MKSDEKKIVFLDRLVEILKPFRKKHKTTVHCHGVFDLMHPGHINHLKAAKNLGDILIVTVTPDEFVNKGPGRPVYNQKIRMESLASLSCVDFVALNKWPEAHQTIRFLHPDVFVKGQEYEAAIKDPNSLTSLEKEAVKSYGGRICFTTRPFLSSSALLNSYFSVFSEETKEWLNKFKSRYSLEKISAYLKRVENLKILLIGDTIIDEYIYCDLIGRSLKESIPRVKYLSTEKFAGGIIAVANHLSSFCNNVTMLTALGVGTENEIFIKNSINSSVKSIIFKRQDAGTVVNKRIVRQAFLEKFFGIYEINDCPIPPSLEAEIGKELDSILPNYDLVVVVDYGFGLMTPALIDKVTEKSKFLALNVQTNSVNLGFNLITKYKKANYVSASDPELRLATNQKFAPLKELAPLVFKKQNLKLIAVTLGPAGSLSYDGKNFYKIPVFNTKALDRVGAGDAYFAWSAPQVYFGANPDVVGFFGNVAGGIAIDIVCNRKPVTHEAFLNFAKTLLK